MADIDHDIAPGPAAGHDGRVERVEQADHAILQVGPLTAGTQTDAGPQARRVIAREHVDAEVEPEDV